MIRRGMLTVILCCFILLSGRALVFARLLPGISLLPDVEKELGEPEKVLFGGMRCEYKAKENDIAKIIVTYDNDKVVSINKYYSKAQTREAVKDKFSLKSPAKTITDADDNLVEYYYPQNISLHYLDENIDSGVIMISEFTEGLFVENRDAKEIKLESNYDGSKVIIFSDREMLKIGQVDEKEKKHAGQIKTPDKVKKDISLPKSEPEELPQTNALKKAEQLLKEDRYKDAIPYFEKAVPLDEFAAHRGLGIVYLKLKNVDKATKHLVAANKLNPKDPIALFFYAILHEELNKPYPARSYYQRYLRTKYDNAEMNEFARERLKAINRKKGGLTTRTLFKAIDTISGELKDF